MSAEYILSRAARLREEMRASGASAYVALNDEDSNWESLFYLSGFRGTAGAIIIYDNAEPELILDGRYAEAGRAQSPYRKKASPKTCAQACALTARRKFCARRARPRTKTGCASRTASGAGATAAL